MWYMPYLRVRSAVIVYAYILVGLTLAAIALRFWPGAIHLNPNGREVHFDLGILVSAGAAFVGGFATVLGLNLAAENDGHLEIAWTRPVSREGYALGVFAVDIVAMAVCIAFTAVCAVVLIDVYHGFGTVQWGSPGGFVGTLGFCGFPLCVYAWIAALSASLKRNRGAVAGLFWPAMLFLGALQFLPTPVIHNIDAFLLLFNPMAIFMNSGGSTAGVSASIDPDVAALVRYAWGWAVAALLLLAALVQWRRLQL